LACGTTKKKSRAPEEHVADHRDGTRIVSRNW